MSRSFSATSTTQDVIDGISLSGKTVVITGGSAGLGLETGRCLAAAGARVVMVARDMSKLEAVLAPLREADPDARFESEQMDLANLSSVREAGKRMAERYPQIDVLIDNAGVMACPLARTDDGFELQFGTNHLGHFLFTNLLVPSLLAAPAARIVVLSSAGHKFGTVDLDDPNYESRDYDKWQAYGQAKTANAQFARGLNDRLGAQGVAAFAVHPGMIVTELGRHLEPEDLKAFADRAGDDPGAFKTVEAGSATSVWAATAPELDALGGSYLEDCQVGKLAAAGAMEGYEAYALDKAQADQLWSLSEQLVGEVFAWT